jgi:hypothetical protein
MATNNTVDDLKAEFGTRFPLLEIVAKKYLGFNDVACVNKKAASGDLPFPAFKLGSNKSPWLVDIRHFAEYIDRQAIDAMQSHRNR